MLSQRNWLQLWVPRKSEACFRPKQDMGSNLCAHSLEVVVISGVLTASVAFCLLLRAVSLALAIIVLVSSSGVVNCS